MAEARYSDPDMIHVGSFKTPEGVHNVAQKGNLFFHLTDKGKIPDGKSPRLNRSAQISRTPEGVLYKLEIGAPPHPEVMGRVMGMLPLDMRSKKVVVKGEDQGMKPW